MSSTVGANNIETHRISFTLFSRWCVHRIINKCVNGIQSRTYNHNQLGQPYLKTICVHITTYWLNENTSSTRATRKVARNYWPRLYMLRPTRLKLGFKRLATLRTHFENLKNVSRHVIPTPHGPWVSLDAKLFESSMVHNENGEIRKCVNRLCWNSPV